VQTERSEGLKGEKSLAGFFRRGLGELPNERHNSPLVGTLCLARWISKTTQKRGFGNGETVAILPCTTAISGVSRLHFFSGAKKEREYFFAKQ
jgi:hypothetical protein